jgi:shikimate 5-dehydrogenase
MESKMGSAYKKNMKNVLGKEDITGTEVLHVGAANVAVTIAAAVDAADAFGVATHTLTRRARLDGLMVDVSPALSSGELEIDLLVNAVSVGTATVTGSSAQLLLDKENGNEVKLVAGDTVKATLEVVDTLSAITDVSVRVHLVLLED